MKVSTKGRYAVMAMIDLAEFSQEKKPVALSEISQRQEISLAYLEQLFLKLRRAKLVKSIRGAHGGYILERPAKQISIAQIVFAADEPMRLTRCHSHSQGCMRNTTRCKAHHLWDRMEEELRLYMEGVSLQDILEGALEEEKGMDKNTWDFAS